jgi:hypothetical protein
MAELAGHSMEVEDPSWTFAGDGPRARQSLPTVCCPAFLLLLSLIPQISSSVLTPSLTLVICS